jgi:hypothetical protein
MTSATLYREGDDLDALLAELEAENPGKVRVIEISRPREGGVFGFFARQRVAVHYQLDGITATDAPGAEPADGQADDFAAVLAQHGAARRGLRPDNPLAELIAAVEEVETRERGAAEPAAPAAEAGRPDPENVEFARMLLQMAARKSLERVSDHAQPRRPLTNGAGRQVDRFVPADLPPLTAHRAPVQPSAWTPAERKTRRPDGAEHTQPSASAPPAAPPEERAVRLTLRRQLSVIGVPIDWMPADAPHRYAAVERLVARLPEEPALPDGPGDIVVLAGPAAATLPAAQALAARMRIRQEQILAIGTGGDERPVEDAWQAATVAADLRLSADGPSIVAVATDGDRESWAAEVIAALRPEAFWAHVDATRKASDTCRLLNELGSPTALFVTGAERTASPASVWGAGVPIALLDGRPASRSAWAVLLLDKLAELES